MTEVRAPPDVQPAIIALAWFWRNFSRRVICLDADTLTVIPLVAATSLQICMHEWSVDNGIFAAEEYGGMMPHEVLLPQYILGPKERTGERMS
jgi:hypothetical protein